jgi:hypothetical protein
VELDPQRVGDLLIPPRPRFEITKHLNLADLAQRAKFFCGCFEFEALKVDIAPQRVGDLRILLGARFQIIKHLNLAVLAEGAKLFCGNFEFKV